MNLSTLTTLMLGLALATSVSLFAVDMKQQVDMANNIQDWIVGVDSYVNENCQSGLSVQDDDSLAQYLPITFRDYGLTWGYDPLTQITTLTPDPGPITDPTTVGRNRAMTLAATVAGGTQTVANGSLSTAFLHQRLGPEDYIGDIYTLPILAYHSLDGTCS